MIKQQLLKLLKLNPEDLNHPADLIHGDFSTNIALKKGISPEEFVKKIPKNDLIEKIEVVKPGFINFYLKKKVLIDELQKPFDFVQGKQKILLEFGQPNTHKVPHIGHLFSYIFGESLSRIHELVGCNVKRLNWQGDVGLHVAKCLYAIKLKGSRVNELTGLEERVGFLQECYQEGSKLYEEDAKAEKEIDELNQKIYQNDPAIYELWKSTRQWSIDYFKLFEQRLGIKYDKYYYESEGAPIGKKIILDNIGKVFEESEGAIVFRGEKYGLHTRVFINKHGNPTYEGKEIGLNYFKQKDFDFDLSIVTTASEQNEFFKVAFKACELLFPKLKGKLKHLGFGLINLATGKMSSRTGDIIDAFSLVDKVKTTIKDEYKTSDELAETIAQAAIKYSFLRSEATKNITFDIQTSIAKEGDSGPYLLYTYVRTKSILGKTPMTKFQVPNKSQIPNLKLNEEEMVLLRTIYKFPEAVENAARAYSPHLLANFIYELARDFNLFYQKHPVLKAEKETQELRLLLTKSVSDVIKNGLQLLGIETVEHM